MIDWCLDITKMEATDMILDITKVITQVLVMHLLTYSIDNKGTLFGIGTLKLLLYATISMVIFNLAVKRFFVKPYISK